MERRIVITGMGLVSPLGCEWNVVWDALVAGKSGIVPVTKYDASPFRTRIAGCVASVAIFTLINGHAAAQGSPNFYFGIP